MNAHAHRLVRSCQRSVRLLALSVVALLATNGIGGVGLASAQVWTAVAPPPHAITANTATLLSDGRVLTVGDGGPPLLFDPANGTWRETVGAPADLVRSHAGAVLLRDGRVLITGGAQLTGAPVVPALRSSYLFDPTTNEWTAADALNIGRYMPSISRLADGSVLIAGGRLDAGPAPTGGISSTAEIYDPATNSWRPTGAMRTGRAQTSLTLLPDRRLLIAGSPVANLAADLYDPDTGTFTGADGMTHVTPRAAGILLASGDVLVIPEWDGVTPAPAQIYAPAMDTWTTLPATFAGVAPALALLLNGDVMVQPTGGSTVILDPSSGATTNVPPALAASRIGGTLTTLPDGRVLHMGGEAAVVPAAEIFDPRSTTIAPAATGAGKRFLGASVLLPNGRVLVVGGLSDAGTSRADGAVYDPATNSWEATPPMSTSRINSPKAVVLRQGGVAVIGGSASNRGVAAVDLFNPATMTWTPGAPMSLGRIGPATTVLRNGWVLVTGGLPQLGDPATALAEIYVPELDRWLPAAPMPSPRWRFGGVRLQDDRVLVAGGVGPGGGGDVRPEAWIYDLRTNSWTPTGSLAGPRLDSQMALLPDGRVLLISFTAPDVSDIWDPATGTWSSIPIAGTPAGDGVLVTLPSGEVALVGGRVDFATASAEIRLFDAATNSWSVAGSLTAARRAPLASVLPDGRLLVLGGVGDDGSSEMFETSELVTISRGRDPLRAPQLNEVGFLASSTTKALNGLAFSPAHAGASSVSGVSSATNHPIVWHRSLTTGEVRTVPLAGWDNTSATLVPMTGYPNGPALMSVRVNGNASASRPALLDPLLRMGSTSNLQPIRYATLDRDFTIIEIFSSIDAPVDDTVVLFQLETQAGVPMGAPVWSQIVQADGRSQASLRIPGGTPPGTYAVRIMYAGNRFHAPQIFTRDLTIAPATTALVLTTQPSVVRGMPLHVVAFATSSIGGQATGTIAISGGGDACSTSAPSGSCELTPQHVGLTTITGTFTPASLTLQSSTAETSAMVICPAITLTSADLPVGQVDQPYAATLGASGGEAPYAFTLASGMLPAGLTLTAGGALTGTPSATFAGTITVRATEQGVDACGGERTYALRIDPGVPAARTYTLAEGVTNTFFASFILMANPHAAEAPVTLTYVGEGGATATDTRTLAPFSRVTIPTGAGSTAETVGASFATRITSESGAPLLIERATYFDAALHAGDLSTAIEEDGSTTRYFAEGANGYFHTYLTLGNQNDQPATVTVRYLPEGGTPFERAYTVAPNSRATIETQGEAALAGAFGLALAASAPIAADRVQYFGTPFIGAHADGGARTLSTDWYFAEGASGSTFDTYFLLANPSADPATVTITYHVDAGEPITRAYPLPGGSRISIGVEAEDARLASGTFWTEMHSDRPIVAERAVYLAGAAGWTDATATTGATAPASRWGLAEGISGGTLGYAPYLLIANPSAQPADVTVQYLRASGDPVSHTYTVPAASRLTLDIRAEEPSLADTEFAILISSPTTPIIVERSLYWTLGGSTFVGAMNTMGTPLPDAPPQP